LCCNFLTATHRLRPPAVVIVCPGDEGSELDGLMDSAEGRTSAATKTERSHLIVWQVAASCQD